MQWPRRRHPPALDFDFHPRDARTNAFGWLLIIVSVAFAADVGWSYASVRQALALRTLEITAFTKAAKADSRPTESYQPKNADREVAFARDTVRRISFPWNDLFKALGRSAVNEVSLLSVEPGSAGGAIQLTGEALDFAALLTYLARLEGNRDFQSVGLIRHEIKRDEPRRPVFFVVTASWKAGQ